MSLPAFLLLTDTAENRTLCRARALSKREAFVASGRGRRQPTEAGADLRSKYADSPRKAPTLYRLDAMLSNLSLPCTASTEPQTRGESNFMQGASVRKTSRQRRVGRAFLTAAQAENPSRNSHSDWDVVSGWHIKRKLRPGILIRNGMQFPNEWLAESSSRNPRSERDTLSQRRSKRKAHPGIPPQTGTHFPLHLPPRKTCAPSIPKLGRRKSKRNRRRSI